MAQKSPQNHIEIPKSFSIAKLFALVNIPEVKLAAISFAAGFIVASIADEAFESKKFGAAAGVTVAGLGLEAIVMHGKRQDNHPLALAAAATGYMTGAGVKFLLSPSPQVHWWAPLFLAVGATGAIHSIETIWSARRGAGGPE